MINKAILVGNVGQVEVRYTQDGKPIANLSLATSDTYKGEKQTEWHKVIFFGKLAEVVENYVKKGSKLYVEGKIVTREWEKEGIKRYSTEIIGNQLQMLDSKPAGSSTPDEGKGEAPKKTFTPVDDFQDDIPF